MQIKESVVFAWIAAGTLALLLVPLLAMQFTTAVSWGVADFIVMGLLLFGTGSLYVLVARRVAPGRRAIIAAAFAIAFLYIWAELAVGVFTRLGS